MSVSVAQDRPYPAASAATTRERGDRPHQKSYCDADEDSALESLLKDIPHTTMPHFNDVELHHVPEGNKDTGWQQCLKAVEKHDADLCQAYREQIDTLLVFAGLFSAVVTAFAVESYQWLLDDPADTSDELLRDVVHLLAQSLNQTAPPVRPLAARLSDSAIARINVFWFLSLTLGLSAALVGILCKQWVREFERDVGQSPETALGVRYIRSRGLTYWKVGTIVNSVPVLLQVSLALFITGIVELLWRLHVTVAICVTIVAGVTLAFYLATTFLPLFQYTYIIFRLCGRYTHIIEDYMMVKAFTEPQCAYKSAQAWIILRAAQPVIEYLIKTYCSVVFAAFSKNSSPLVLRPADSWITFDINWMKRRDFIHWGARSAYETLAWIAENLGEKHLSSSIWHCVWDRWLQARRNSEVHVAVAQDVGCVARAFPGPIHLDSVTEADIRCQASVFHCSLQTILSADTAVEMILRIAPVIGVDSRWTCEAAKTVRIVYRETPFRLSNDMVVGLFRLAKLQTQAIIRRPTSASDSGSHSQGAEAFYEVFVLLPVGGADYRERFLPAMCALALQWFRCHPDRVIGRVSRTSHGDFAHGIISSMITYYAKLHCGLAHLHESPGVIFPARLAAMVAEISPQFAQHHPHPQYWPYGRMILEKLFDISYASAGDGPLRSGTQPAPPPVAHVHANSGEPSLSATARIPSVSPILTEAIGNFASAAPAEIAISTEVEGQADLNTAASPADSPGTAEL